MTIRHIFISIILFSLLTAISSCATSKIKDGETAYERKQYAVAIDLLTSEYDNIRNKADKARKAYLLGKSYDKTGETDNAAKWLQSAFDNGYGPEATQSLAKAYKKLGQYGRAIEVFKDLKRHVSGRDQQINREIFVCEQLSQWAPDDKFEYKLNLEKFNSPDADYGPVLFDDNYLIFTSDRQGSTGSEIYNWTGADYSDMYITPRKGNNPKRFDAILNSKHNDGTPCFTKDYQEIYFTRCYSNEDAKDAYCKIMYSERYTGVWSEPTPLDFVIEGFNYGHPTLIEKDSIMVFSADLTGSLGGHDLFYAERLPTPDGGHIWSEPSPMPSTINTEGEEMFPTGDGDTLYYSSDFLPGYGGLDIFKTYLSPNGQWSPPENLKKPINSSEDDFGFIVDYGVQLRGKTVQKGYFSSSRKGYGYEDIYGYEKISKTPIDTIPTEPKPQGNENQYIINLVIQTKSWEYNNPEDATTKSDQQTSLPEVKVVLTDKSDTKLLSTDSGGRLIVPLKEGKEYSIRASKTGYLNSIRKINTRDLTYPEGQLSITLNETLVLEKVFYGQEIVLENIYYDYDKWNIRDDAKPTLDSLTSLLKNNPQIRVELSSHTDCQGENDYNMILSQKRAQAAVSYMQSKGLSSGTMTPRGYGESTPTIDCVCETCTPEQHQANRRTSFKILR